MNAAISHLLPPRTVESNAERRARTEREVRAAFQSIKDAIDALERPLSRAEVRALLGVNTRNSAREALARALIETGQAEGLFMTVLGQVDFKKG